MLMQQILLSLEAEIVDNLLGTRNTHFETEYFTILELQNPSMDNFYLH